MSLLFTERLQVSRNFIAACLVVTGLASGGCATQGSSSIAPPADRETICRHLLPVSILPAQDYTQARAPRVSVVWASEPDQGAFAARLPELEKTARQYSSTLPSERIECHVASASRNRTAEEAGREAGRAVGEALEAAAFVGLLTYYWPYLPWTLPDALSQLSAWMEQRQLIDPQTMQSLKQPRDECDLVTKLQDALSKDQDLAVGADDTTLLKVTIIAANVAPSGWGHNRSCFVLTANLALLKTGQEVWSDVLIAGPTLASSDLAEGILGGCLSARAGAAGALSLIGDLAARQVSDSVRTRLPGLPWKPIAASEVSSPY